MAGDNGMGDDDMGDDGMEDGEGLYADPNGDGVDGTKRGKEQTKGSGGKDSKDKKQVIQKPM